MNLNKSYRQMRDMQEYLHRASLMMRMKRLILDYMRDDNFPRVYLCNKDEPGNFMMRVSAKDGLRHHHKEWIDAVIIAHSRYYHPELTHQPAIRFDAPVDGRFVIGWVDFSWKDELDEMDEKMLYAVSRNMNPEMLGYDLLNIDMNADCRLDSFVYGYLSNLTILHNYVYSDHVPTEIPYQHPQRQQEI